MKKPASIFGWKNVLHNYGWKGILLDSILPIIISTTLCMVMYLNDSNVFFQLKHLIDVGLNVVPAMVALILAAYAILLTFIISDKFKSIKETENGKVLIIELNSGFAACLFLSSITIIVMIVTSCVVNLEIPMDNPCIINYSIFFLVCYLLLYSVAILINVVIDIFNCGQTTLINETPKDKK